MAFSADELEGLQLQTLALRTGELPTEFGAHSAPIFMRVSVEQSQAIFIRVLPIRLCRRLKRVWRYLKVASVRWQRLRV